MLTVYLMNIKYQAINILAYVSHPAHRTRIYIPGETRYFDLGMDRGLQSC